MRHISTAKRTSFTRLALGSVATLALGLASMVAAIPAHADNFFPEFTIEELIEHDYVLYFANSGAAEVDSVAQGDFMGLYQTLTDQAYGPDAKTGASWGYIVSDTSDPRANSNSSNDKKASVRYDAKPQDTPVSGYEKRNVTYAFGLPNGTYDVTVGYRMPSGWTDRSMDVYMEETFVGTHKATAEGTQYVHQGIEVVDGELNVRVNSQPGRTNSYTDPAVGWIEVRLPVSFGVEELQALIDLRTLSAEERARYAPDSLIPLDEALANAAALLEGTPTLEEIAEARAAIDSAWAQRREILDYDTFRPGQAWLDTSGKPIQGHGGQVLPDPAGSGNYYWFGEDRTHGYQPMDGIHAYSSSDLYNWDDQGVVMRAATSRAQLDEDPYFSDLYADYTDIQKDIAFLDLDRDGTLYDHGQAVIFERPKVAYNSATDQWVMWIHTDGPTPFSSAQYAKATAGVAVADEPFGPYRYVDSYRLNYVPADDPDNKYPSQLGMARDMNLFVDTGDTDSGGDEAYIVYSSEENLTMYVSSLDASYTFLQTYPDDAEKGVDFTNNWPGGQREAPAMFKYDQTYYMITSGATGWDPNPADYATASNPLGPWTRHGNPATAENGGKPATTHGSQSTSVITIDEDAGKFIYMGDRWTPSDLANAPYVWLPLDFGEEESMSLPWMDEWRLEDLEGRSRFSWDAELPTVVALGEEPNLPSEIVMNEGGQTTTAQVDWDTSELALPGIRTIEGTVTSLSGKSRTITASVVVVPEGLSHIVDSGGDGTGLDYLKIIEAVQGAGIEIATSVPDQSYGPDPATGRSWGYVGDNTEVSGSASASWTESLRYVLSSADNRSLEYRFSGLEDGTYTVYAGFYDPWSQWAHDRSARVHINGQVVEQKRPIPAEETVGIYANIQPEDGEIAFVLEPVGDGEGTDVQVSWLMVARD